METAYQAKLSEYRRKVLSEFQKLKRFNGSEIVLWYEYDVFCQVNFIALISYILKSRKEVKLSIICVGDHPDFNKRVGLGEIPTTEYEDLFSSRTALSRSTMREADKAWMLWCGKMHSNLEKIDFNGLPYLKDALQASTVLFSEGDGSSELEKRIGSMLSNEGMSDRDVVRNLLLEDKALGFGDLQYFYLVDRIKKEK